MSRKRFTCITFMHSNTLFAISWTSSMSSFRSIWSTPSSAECSWLMAQMSCIGQKVMPKRGLIPWLMSSQGKRQIYSGLRIWKTHLFDNLFDRITKCSFYKYGHSGTIERHDAMCVLALNIINEKIYVFLWFWYIILAVMTSLYLLYVLAVIAVPSMRRVMVERNAKFDIKVRVECMNAKLGTLSHSILLDNFLRLCPWIPWMALLVK